MGFGPCKVNGIEDYFTINSGIIEVFLRPDPKVVQKFKKVFPETIRSCKPFKPECEFCKEKIGLLNDDIFIKESKVS